MLERAFFSYFFLTIINVQILDIPNISRLSYTYTSTSVLQCMLRTGDIGTFQLLSPSAYPKHLDIRLILIRVILKY